MKNLKIFTENVEQEAIDQINLLMEQVAFTNSKIRIMPDVHAGAGCVIGFTGNLGDKVIPNIVGVDIGCGMLTTELGNSELDLQKIDYIIHNYIPSGFNIHDGRKVKYPEILELKCYRNLKDTKRFERSLGTLGGGNHFIEIDEALNGNKYLVIHTGSRNLGKQVADYYQNLAIELCSGKDKMYDEIEEIIKIYKEQGRRKEIQAKIKEIHKEYKDKIPSLPKDLCYLTGKYRDDYLHDMHIAQDFAKTNRELIRDIILSKYFENDIEYISFETIHNYIDIDSNIVRKGAISAKKDEKVLIPINMKDGCIIAIGKGNEDWNFSAPHGAGRIMSRGKARAILDFEEYKKSMEGIYTTSVNENTIDEAPMVYKPIEEIIENIKDTVEIIDIIKPIYNYKASDD